VVFKWPGRPIIEEAKGDFYCVANLSAWKFPAGEAGNIAGLRIQIAAKGVNSFIYRPAIREIRLMYNPLLYRMSPLFALNEERPQTTQAGYSFRSFQTKPRNYCYLFSTPPYPSFIQIKTALACRAGARACEVSGRAPIAAILD
jgi:hypothetical protein